MNIWETLGIQPTSDIETIKLAYAAKAKEAHPEEDPEGYQILRQAYKAALQSAKVQKNQSNQNGSNSQSGASYIKAAMEESETPGKEEQEQSVSQAENLFGPHSQGETLCQDEGLSFEEVEKSIRREVYDQFFREFRYISFNPCLRNNFFGWRHFFCKKEYQSLFLNEEFRKEFVRTVSEGLFWEKETLEFFDRRLQDLSGGMEPEKIVWEQTRRRHCLKKLFLGSDKGEMGEIHRIIMHQVEETGIPTDRRAQNRKEAAVYLQFYLSYAAEHEDEVEQWYENEWKGIMKRKIKIVLFLAALFIVLCLLTLI